MRRSKSLHYRSMGILPDEEGIRHPIIDDNAETQIDEPTAIFVHSSCANFISFIVRRYVME